MTTLREAATQALEALEYHVEQTRPIWKTSEAIAALEAALAEPVQEQPVCDECGKHKRDGWALYCVGCVEPMFTSKTEPVEPVAWMNTEDGFCTLDSPVEGIDVMSQWAPLYAAPPQRKPLSEEELDALAIDEDGLPNSHIEFARAVERAHGIGGDE